MLAALAVVIPLGLGGAVSPVMLTEQTGLLAGPTVLGERCATPPVCSHHDRDRRRHRAVRRAISLQTEPHLVATLDLVVGLIAQRRSRYRVNGAVPLGGRSVSPCRPWR
jgi:hypothetical protein